MNPGKLEVVKQEMARVNVDILGISELKWTGWVNLTQMIIISIPSHIPINVLSYNEEVMCGITEIILIP